MKTLSTATVALALGMLACSNNPETSETASVTPAAKIARDESPRGIDLKVQIVADQLHSPVAAVFLPGTNDMLVCEQTGQVRLIRNGKLEALPFLDLSSKMVRLSGVYDERGLLGIALHPAFSTNKKFYVYYSAPSTASGSDHKSVIAEYIAGATTANRSSERVLLTIEQPESNHNGGCLQFGPDKMLYIAVGDGGGAGDKHGPIGNGQNLKTLLGKILRIDVNAATYKVPADNPFMGGEAESEIWAYGLRNPWKFSFDRLNGRLFAADVGQNKYEEINIIQKGGNYGWRITEGKHCYQPSSNCNTAGLRNPIFEYDHDIGVSITGGYIYRGKAIPQLAGRYVYGDWTGPLFYLEQGTNGWESARIRLQNEPAGEFRILSFAQDNAGELYVLSNRSVGPKQTTGSIYKLIKP